MLAIKRLAAGYGAVEALHDVDLEVEKGEWLAILGPVGAGKSTLLGTIAGLIPSSSGEIALLGESLAGRRADERLRRGIALVPEGRRLFTGMSVRENLLAGAYVVQPRQRIDSRLAYVMGLFPVLGDRYRQISGTLSGGEQQMCAIGRALMSEPALLMIDEVSLGLSPKVVERLFAALATISRQGTTLITVEQNIALVLEHANRACVLRNGTLVATGQAAQWRDDAALHRLVLGY